ncbi:BEN domain-containing protein 2 isoform X2 [Hemicordylus capensis]|nr:BEN domain-containing protein 2 isoform X2 [Hemicordylus capensis]XP_053162623.1 BEN domain-containing protein 2 isoform X2 [Hemicordylus capensis]
MSVEKNIQINSDDQYVTQLAYENEDLLAMGEPPASQTNLSMSRSRLGHSPEPMEFVYLRKRRRPTSSQLGMKSKEAEYEDGSVIYEYDPDYECGSVISEASYTGDQQKTLMEVLNYCQAMYDAIQKLDKKFDSLHRKDSEMQHSRLKPLLFKPRPVGFTYRSSSSLSPAKIRVQKPMERGSGLQIPPPGHGNHSPPMKVRLQRAHIQASPAVTTIPHTLKPESQQSLHRESPPLPTIVSTHSLYSPFSMASEIPELPSQTSLATIVNESPGNVTVASQVVSSAMPTPSAMKLERNNMMITYKAPSGSTNIHNEMPPSSSSSSTSINPAIASTHSLYPSFSTASEMPELPSQASLAATVIDSPAHMASSPVSSQMVSSVMPPETSLGENNMMVTYRTSGSTSMSNEMPSSSISSNFEFVGDPKRNVKVLGNYLMKARQKTRPKYAARYLVRVLFPKETLLCSVMGVRARGRRTLDPNKIAAIREFLATYFLNYDLSEHGRDWKTCITNVNAMIRCLRYETKTNPEIIEGKEKPPDTPDTSMCVDLVDNGEENEVNSQTTLKVASSTSNKLQNSAWDNNNPEVFYPPPPSKLPSLEPMATLGNPLRNVQLPFSVIYVAKGKSRPELSARYLIRHLFTEDVLVKSNVYGNLERGTYPLDCNKINALRDFLQENYPSFDLMETGYDWKACVAAINSTIRSLRYDHKRASAGVRSKALAETLPLSRSSKSLL